MLLLQWRDARKRFLVAGKSPAVEQFFPVQLHPFSNAAERVHWKATMHIARSDLDRNFVRAKLRVQVGRQVLAVVHPDDDSVEAGDLGHGDHANVSAQAERHHFIALWMMAAHPPDARSTGGRPPRAHCAPPARLATFGHDADAGGLTR